MMQFLFGVVVGIFAYRFYVRTMAETQGDRLGPGRIERPSGTDVHGRPHEPLPAEREPEPELEHPGGTRRRR